MCLGNADGKTAMACVADVRTDFADVKGSVDAAACTACMTTLAEEIEAATSPTCNPGGLDDARITAACDADPARDADGNGEPDDDTDVRGNAP